LVLASFAPSVETAVEAGAGRIRTVRPARSVERAATALVETVPPEGEDRSARLARLLRAARSAALIVSRRGYGVARVCRSCGAEAACAVCGGPIVVEAGVATCRVCEAPGRCAVCAGATFGVERGGVERVAQWAGGVFHGPVGQARPGEDLAVGTGAAVGTAAAVKDIGPRRLDLVAILDPDRALARPGLHAAEQAVATWMEAAGWARPRAAGGRVLLQTRHPGHPAIQAMIRWDPVPFLAAEAARRAEAGFPPLHAVFRVRATRSDGAAERAIGEAGGRVVVTVPAEGSTLCLVTVRPDDVPRFRRAVVDLAVDGTVDRVDAEPPL
jgi:primosomal protein N' (replication factor Y)